MTNLNTLANSAKLILQLSDATTPEAIQANIQLLTNVLRIVGTNPPQLPADPIAQQQKLIAIAARSLGCVESKRLQSQAVIISLIHNHESRNHHGN